MLLPHSLLSIFSLLLLLTSLPSCLPSSTQICSILHNYKECKPSLKREGWEMATFVRMQREYAGQFEFEIAGKEQARLAKSKKKKSGKEDKKKTTRRAREREERSSGGSVRIQEVSSEGPTLPSRPSTSPQSSSPVQEPGYQTIPTSSQPQPTTQTAGVCVPLLSMNYTTVHLHMSLE